MIESNSGLRAIRIFAVKLEPEAWSLVEMAKRKAKSKASKPSTAPEPRAFYRVRRTLSIRAAGLFRTGEVGLLTEAQYRADRNSLVMLTPDTPVRIQVRPGQQVSHAGHQHGPGDLVQCTFADAQPIVISGAAAIVEAAHQDATAAWVFTRTRIRGGMVPRPETEHLIEVANAAGL